MKIGTKDFPAIEHLDAQAADDVESGPTAGARIADPHAQPAYLFLDIETTGLDESVDEITEIAYILAGPSIPKTVSYQAILQHTSFPTAWVLENTDYLQRILRAPKTPLSSALLNLHGDLQRASSFCGKVYLVGANPSFDDRFLRAAARKENIVLGYHHRLIDVEVLVMGRINLTEPPSLSRCSTLLQSARNDTPHTAMADVEEARRVFRAVMGVSA